MVFKEIWSEFLILDVYAGVGPFARMVFDASPWGAGGFLVVDGKFVSWFATKFDDVDEKAIGIRFGDSASQQAAEALAVLLGVRACGCYDNGCEHAHTQSANCSGGQRTCVDLF